MKASVDPEKCQGHARCWEIAPDVFDLDDEGHSFTIVDEIPAGSESKAQDAARNCPERAITLS